MADGYKGNEPHETYWRNRNEQMTNVWEMNEEKLASNLGDRYDRMGSDLADQMTGYLDRYGSENVIEYQDMMQQLSPVEKNQLYTNYTEFFERHPHRNHLVDIRESIYKFNRMQGLTSSIYMDLADMGIIEHQELEKHLKTASSFFTENTGKAFNKTNLSMGKVSSVDGLIQRSNFSSNIWTSKQNLLNSIERDLIEGMLRGDSRRNIAKNMEGRLGQDQRNNIMRVIRTEGTFIVNETVARDAEEAGLWKEYRYNSIIDSRTSDACRFLDGKIFKFADRERGLNYPPMHPNCRSQVDFVFDKEQKEQMEKDMLDGLAQFTDEELKKIERDTGVGIEQPSLEVWEEYARRAGFTQRELNASWNKWNDVFSTTYD